MPGSRTEVPSISRFRISSKAYSERKASYLVAKSDSASPEATR